MELMGRLVHAARAEGVLGEYVWALVELANEREEAGDFASAVSLLDEASQHASGAEAFELGLKVAHLSATELEDLRRSADVYERLRREEPTDARAWKPLLDVLRRLGAFAEVEACIAQTVEAVYDPAERNHLRMERGRILLEDPARQDEAEAVLRAVLDEDPDHAQATVVLAELLERTGRIDELNDLIGRQLEGARDRGDAAAISALTLRIGKSLEQENRGQAIALYRDSLASTNNERALLEALLRLYGEGDDPNDRAFVLERLLEVETGRAAARLAMELATVAESLGDQVAVERALRRGYEAAPSDDTARDRLVSFYRAREDFAGVAQVLAVDARRRPAAEAAIQLREAAELYEQRLEDPLRAATLYGEARSAEPGNVELVFDMARAYVAASRPEDAFVAVSGALNSGVSGAEPRARLLALRARLRPAVEGERATVLATSIDDLDQAAALSGGGFEAEILELLEMQRKLAAASSDDVAERAATMRLASLLPKAAEQRRGLELLVGWVKRKPNDAEAVRGLGQFAANSEKWSAAAKAFARLVEITDGADQIDAVIRLAEACELAGSPMDARAPLEQVYAKAPHDEMLRSRLRRTYETAGAYAELATIMIAEAERAPDDNARFARLVEAGDLSLRVQGGEQTAIVAFRRAYALRSEAHDVIIKLTDALSATGDIEEAANILDRAIDAFGKRRSPELAELQHAMARVGRIAGDWEAVFAWLDAAVQTDRQNGAAASELAVIAMERGEHDIAIKALQAITLLKGEAPMSKAEAYLRQGMIAETKGDPKKAVFLAKRALTQEPDFADAKAFLERLGAA
jgi:thioredoxin-like negative regulator of GroEL